MLGGYKARVCPYTCIYIMCFLMKAVLLVVIVTAIVVVVVVLVVVVVVVVRGSHIMFCNLDFQQHLQPLCLLQFFEDPPPLPLSLYTFDHPLKPAVYDTRPR